MTTMTQLNRPVSSPLKTSAPSQRRTVVSDGGPLLFLAAPISFVIVLAFVIYLSRISF